ncbi:unnamed protein product [Thlaspi arvense]|uniref:C2H2-type domain-containing protein n=1 Tax=Thlaspi arvense TaxID=13288 RepID=A0AAU9SE48_THLAR|nr:unnamed protein product [Thlaspi arvense]
MVMTLVVSDRASAVRKHFGPNPVTIFAIGNLEIISPHILKEVSSAGILLSHAPTPLVTLYSILGTLPCTHSQIVSHQPNPGVETFLLKGPSGPSVVEETLEETVEPACFCRVCKISIQSSDAFIEHLMSREHAGASACSPEFDEPLLFCGFCEYSSYDRHNMIIHYSSSACYYSSSACYYSSSACHYSSASSFSKSHYPLPKTTVVLWDLDTCPVPPGYDIGRVGPSIESALKKLFDGGAMEVDDVLDDWRRRIPGLGKREYNAMLISVCRPAETYGSYKEWLWEDWLKEKLFPPLETNSPILEDKCIEKGEHDAWFCRLCEIPSQSFDDFIDHLKSEEHKEEQWEMVIGPGRIDETQSTILSFKILVWSLNGSDLG